MTVEQTTPIISSAKEYSEAGFTIIKLNGKIPVEKNWTQADYIFPDDVPTYLKDWQGNFGVVLSSRDLVIDIDPRNFPAGDKPHVRLFKDIGVTNILEFSPIVKTGSGGMHVYLRLPVDISAIKEGLKEYPGVEFKTVKRQVVGAGSIHPDNHKPYVLANKVGLDKIAIIPPALLKLLQKPKLKIEKVMPTGPVVLDEASNIQRFVEYLETAPVAHQGENGDKTTYNVACRGRDYGLSQARTYECLLQFYNPKCQPPWSAEELNLKVENAYNYATGAPGNATAEGQFSRVDAPVASIIYERDRSGRPKKLMKNMFNVLMDPQHPFVGCLVFDEFNALVRVVKKLPWSDPKKEWTDMDTAQLRLWCSLQIRFEVPVEMLDSAVLLAALEKKVHPIRDYIDSVKWDGLPRLEEWLIQAAGADDNPYERKVSKSTIMQAVNRAYNPGCQADYILVLEGVQGIGKTSLIKILAGEYYGDLTVDPHAKDTIDSMKGKWMIELSEMEVTRRADAQALKAFITRATDSVRLAYARRSIDYKRQSIFIGSINPDATNEYLADQTGNRRFWPVTMRFLNRELLHSLRDQLFAEALVRLRQGETTYIEDETLAKVAHEEQKLRQVSDPWFASVWGYLMSSGFPDVATKDVYKFALSGAEANMTGVHQRRIAHCLREANYANVVARNPNTGECARVYRYQGERKKDDTDIFS
jgi:predicted P-loop ATPase